MAGFLDPNAPSIEAEYVRFLDSDILGKFVFKRFMLDVIGASADEVFIPLGKRVAQVRLGRVCADAQVRIESKWIDIEIKCACLKRAAGASRRVREKWSPGGLTKTPKGLPRRYDIAFVVCVNLLGFDDQSYWQDLQRITKRNEAICQKFPHLHPTRSFSQATGPDAVEYLTECTFFIIPFAAIRRNGFCAYPQKSKESNAFRAYPQKRNEYAEYEATGRDRESCHALWTKVVSPFRSLGTVP